MRYYEHKTFRRMIYMIKNLTQKIGIVTGVVVTEGLDAMKQNKLVVAGVFGMNLIASKSVKHATKATVISTSVGVLSSGIVGAALHVDEFKQAFKELDSEETEEINEEGEE